MKCRERAKRCDKMYFFERINICLMKLWIILGLCLGITFRIEAQSTKTLDSLNRAYELAPFDTSKILILADIAHQYRRSKPDTSALLAQKALEQSEKLNFEKGKAKSLNVIGVGHYLKGNYELALKNYEKSMDIYQKLNYQKGVATNLNNIGNIYEYQGKYSLSLDYYQKSLQIKEGLKDFKGMAGTFNNIANVYKNQNNEVLALSYYQKSLELMEKTNDLMSMGIVMSNMGNIHRQNKDYGRALEYYQHSLKIKETLNDNIGTASNLNNIGLVYYEKTPYYDLEKALLYFQQSLKFSEMAKDKRIISTNLTNIGAVYKIQKNYTEALTFFEKSLKIKEELNDKKGATHSLNGMAEVYMQQGNYDMSLKYIEKAIEIAQEIGSFERVQALTGTLFTIYKGKKDYEKALQYHELYKQYQDSFFTLEKTKQIANLETKSELLHKEKEIVVLNQKQELLKKDQLLQKIALEKQQNANLVMEKEAETLRLIALARNETDRRKQDSLLNLAQKSQLETDNLKVRKRQLEAENKLRDIEILNEREITKFQQIMIALAFGIIILIFWQFYRRKKLLLKLKEANQTKDHLFAIIAHDLRSPLAAFQVISKQIDYYLRKNQAERIQEFGQNIEQAGKNLSHLLDNLLNWALSQQQKIRIEITEVDFEKSLTHVCTHYQNLALLSEISLEYEIPKPIIIFTDVNILQTILRNLINNALKYTPQGGKVRVSAYEMSEKIQVEISDTGIGMSADIINNLFAENKIHSTRGVRNEKGTGLGLVLVSQFIQTIGGEIQVESQENVGTNFLIILPKNAKKIK